MDTIFNGHMDLKTQENVEAPKTDVWFIMDNGYKIRIYTVSDVYFNGEKVHRARNITEAMKWIASQRDPK